MGGRIITKGFDCSNLHLTLIWQDSGFYSWFGRGLILYKNCCWFYLKNDNYNRRTNCRKLSHETVPRIDVSKKKFVKVLQSNAFSVHKCWPFSNYIFIHSIQLFTVKDSSNSFSRFQEGLHEYFTKLKLMSFWAIHLGYMYFVATHLGRATAFCVLDQYRGASFRV